jgi:sulfonate transport system permease protein
MVALDTPDADRVLPAASRSSRQDAAVAGGFEDLSVAPGGKRRRREVPTEIRRLYGPLALLAIWALLSGTGVLGPRVFPTPWAVVAAGVELGLDGTLWRHLWASLERVLVGLAIGLTIGVVLATLAGTLRRFEDSIDSIMQILKAIPNFTLVPLLIIWMGIDDPPKITLIVLSVSMPIYINTYSAIRNVDARLIESARTLGLNSWERTRHIVLPGALPGFLVGLRIALTNAWLALVFAETINAREGLGALMSDARAWWQLDVMVLVITIYAILGLVSYAFVRYLERTLLAWRRGFTGD